MLTCAEASKRISEALDRDLGWRERASLRFHVLMCAACRRYQSQIQGLERLLRFRRTRAPDAAEDEATRLSPARRQAIRRLLRDRS